MSRRFTRLFLLSVLMISSKVWAIGLGDIKLDSALNEPLRAEIILLSATPDEIIDLTVDLASAETFQRYGIDRPFFLQDIEFNIVNGGVAGSVVQLRSNTPITEPFLTFLVEATWPSGRLLREYTVLLDPPTYAPPAVQQAPAVTAPQRNSSSDSGRIERAPAQSAPVETQTQPARQAPQPARTGTSGSVPKPQPPADDVPYDTAGSGDYTVQHRDTLWGIASRLRPDSRLTMNQTMLAIFEANRDAFGGNINLLKEGASLRIPSASEVFQISRGDALREVQRQHSAWGVAADDGGYETPATTRPSLTLVPPDEEPADTNYYDDVATTEPLSREDELAERIAALEATEVPDQPSLIEIRDNELASLRQELANIRGEVYEPPVDEPVDYAGDDPFVDADDAMVDDTMVDDTTVDDGIDDLLADTDDLPADDDMATGIDDATVADAEPEPATTTRTSRREVKSLLDQVLEFATGIWGIIAGALLLVVGALFWFMRRGSGDDDDARPWETLDADDDIGIGSLSATETLSAPSPDDTIVVVEQDTGINATTEQTIASRPVELGDDATSEFGSMEDTFSSDTAINLDQTDPIAEADFHMAYGLYDQAADLISGALETDPSDKGLMSKLCEIYFVWGNRDAFVDAATRLKAAVGGGANAEWDKIVIMGQQIAADHNLFAGADVAGVTREVDLSFDADDDDVGALDMDFGAADSDAASDMIDFGADEADAGVDFLVDEATVENPALDVSSGSDEFAVFEGGTADLPSLDVPQGDATAEINLDDLDLDISGLDETGIASLDDLDATGQNEALSDTGLNEILSEATGRNPTLDPDAFVDLDETGMMSLAPDETGRSPVFDIEDELDRTGIDESLLDATGLTQVLSEDLVVDTVAGFEDVLTDNDATLLAPIGEDDDFDFAKTEALPPDVYSGDSDLDATAEAPAIARTDVDLDLDDLTEALRVSDVGDTVEQIRDDETVEQPRPTMSGETAEIPTMELSPDDMSDDLQDARTMTEVGTKLDLARAYVDMGDPTGARSILEEVIDEGDAGQKQQAQQLLDSLPG